jgi:hypothetical protein
VSARGSLDGVSLEYLQPRSAKDGKGQRPVPELRVKGRLRDFLFKHKIGFRALQKSIVKVKVDKRKKRSKPIDLQLALETAGANNRVETDVLRMAFVGDLAVRGVYPYTLLTGEFSSLKGELGQTSQSYDITDFDLKWQNATVEEGRITVEGGKKLRVNCKPETERTCNVYVKLAGRLDEMAFTYDSDCGANTGENLEPTALINSVSRGCWSEEDVAGAGNGNYGEAVVALLERQAHQRGGAFHRRLDQADLGDGHRHNRSQGHYRQRTLGHRRGDQGEVGHEREGERGLPPRKARGEHLGKQGRGPMAAPAGEGFRELRMEAARARSRDPGSLRRNPAGGEDQG